MDVSQQQHYRSLYIEHMTEVGFNLSERQIVFQTETLSWQDCAELEQFIAAHLSALRLGGAEAYLILLEHLESIDEDEVLGAVFSLVSIDRFSEGIEAVIEAFQKADEDILPLYVDALKHGMCLRLSHDLLPLLESESPLIQAAAIEVLGYRGDLDPKRLWPLLHESDALVQTSVMVALMRLGYHQALPVIEELILKNADASDEMLLLLLVLGSSSVQAIIRKACQNSHSISEQRLIFLTLFGGAQDLPLLVNALNVNDMKPAVWESLGILGDVQGVPLLIDGLKSEIDEERIAAATALNYLTGANLTQKVTMLEVEEPDLEVSDITVDQSIVTTTSAREGDQREIEVELPCLDTVIWQNWWQTNQGQFDTSHRWRQGFPITKERLVNELNQPQIVYQNRQLVYFELIIRFRVNVRFEADWFVAKQISALKSMHAMFDEELT